MAFKINISSKDGNTYKLELDGISYWQSLTNIKCSDYISDDHFKVTLGEDLTCTNTATGDAVVREIENLGDNTYRVYLNYWGVLPIINYQALVINGLSAPDNSWVDQNVVDAFPCYYADIHWPHTEAFQFTYCVDTEGGIRECVDPTGSAFLCEGHLCIDFTQYQ